MKYLFYGKRNDEPLPPPEEWIVLLQAARDYQSALIEDGTIDCAYGFLEAESGFAIYNADSHAQANDYHARYPLGAFYKWEIEPLCDLIDIYDRYIKLLKEQLG
jgi:hypothetical protein